MSNRKSSSQKIDDAVAKSVNFEITVADLARRSERRAWWVALCALVMALVLAGGYFYILPLKEKVPYVIMADAYTGVSSVARLTDDFTDRRISSSEAINRSNVAHFVLARESFDVAMINLHDWATVLTMSAPGVAAEYTGLHAQNNPNAPYKMYGRDQAIRVKISSIVLIGGGPGVTPKGATVRFQRSLFNKLTGASRPMDSKLATIEFTYKPNLKMDDQNRIENPLGFQVTSYHVDSDYASPALAEDVQDASQAAASTQQPVAQPAADPQDPGAVPAPGTDGTQQPGVAAPPVSYQAGPQPAVPVPLVPTAAPTPAPAPTSATRTTANGVGRR
ncbi:MAG TPA: type IV secretion system protein [Luteibacter sp.]|jgi:type IV secretion system protein VirB8|nr:type IV secretion system protein [Luteibacter sp.]